MSTQSTVTVPNNGNKRIHLLFWSIWVETWKRESYFKSSCSKRQHLFLQRRPLGTIGMVFAIPSSNAPFSLGSLMIFRIIFIFVMYSSHLAILTIWFLLYIDNTLFFLRRKCEYIFFAFSIWLAIYGWLCITLIFLLLPISLISCQCVHFYVILGIWNTYGLLSEVCANCLQVQICSGIYDPLLAYFSLFLHAQISYKLQTSATLFFVHSQQYKYVKVFLTLWGSSLIVINSMQ